MKRKDRTGEIRYNNQGLKMKIVRYKNTYDIDIEFENGYIKKNSDYSNFKKGTIKNPYCLEVCGVGYIGEGEYKGTINRKRTKEYEHWSGMLKRCYDEKKLIKNPTYKGCSVCEEWHNFQNFAEWFHNNYYEVDGEMMSLDKDILVKGNKVYSPETCMFVPQRINTLFINKNSKRCKYPIGVQKDRNRKGYTVKGSIKDKTNNYIGHADTIEKAFNIYKEFKENYIKQVADEYKDKIPEKLYEAMINWIVEITD